MKDKITLNSDAVQLRKKWGQDPEAPVDIFAIAELQENITVASLVMPETISGVCIKDDTSIVIGINSDMSWGRQRYTLAHELYHGYFEEGKTCICEKNFDGRKPDSERNADRFASYFLIPYEALTQYSREKINGNWTCDDVILAEQFFQISHQALLIRLLEDKEIERKQYDDFCRTPVISKSMSMGFNTSLYRKSRDEDRYNCNGEYIRKIEIASKEGIIGAGKKKELLLDGFCVENSSIDASEDFVGDD